MRIAALVTIVSECAGMKFTRTFRDPWIRLRHRLNHSMETNSSTTTAVWELTYSEGHSHCQRTYENAGRNHRSNICVMEDLDIIPKAASVQERLNKGDMRVLGNRAYVLTALRGGQGITMKFGTPLIKQHQVLC